MSPVTSKIVVGVFGDAEQARRAVEELRRAGFHQDSISMLIRSTESERPAESSKVLADAEIGAAAGGIGGVLLGLAAVAVPGVGLVAAMGPILGGLGGAGIGAVAGGLIGSLTKIGVPHEKAQYYAESVRRGDAVVTVRTDPEGAERALRIMDEQGALDIDARAAGWRERGWQGHNPGVEPLSEDELRREREFYAARGHRVDEWKPETERARRLAGDEPGTLWPHAEAYDIGEDLVETATTEDRFR
jgi:uncharacterized membrane protein